MSMTAIYVEQVIIGFFVIVTAIVLATGALPAVGDKPTSVLFGFALIAASYVVGILYDRCSDSLLARLERLSRILFATKNKTLPLCTDPFPEYRSRLDVNAPWAAYLSSRMRLMRAFTTLVPAMTVATLVYRQDAYALVALAAVIVAYVATALLALLCTLPRTDDVDGLNDFLSQRQPGEHWLDPILAGLGAIVIVALRIASTDPQREIAYAIVAAGAGLTLLTGWAWLRVTDTLLHRIRDSAPNPTGPAPRGYSDISPRSPGHTRLRIAARSRSPRNPA